MFCKNCGKELPDTANFCSACGTPVASAEPRPAPVSEPEAQEPVIPAGNTAPEAEENPAVPETEESPAVPETEESPAAPEAEAPAAFEAPAWEEPVPPAQPAVPEESGVPAPVKRRGKSGLIVIGGLAVAAILAIVLVVKLAGGLLGGGNGGGGRTPAFAYLTDDSELMYLADLKEKTEAIEVSDKNYPGSVQFTRDGKTLYFQDGDDTLYKIAVSELKKGGRPERVARDVALYSVLDNGTLVYSKWDSDGYEVTCVTDKESFRLVKACDYYQLDKAQKNLCYTEYDQDDNEYTLCRIALQKDAREEELLDGYYVLYTDWDADLLVYSKNDADPSASWSEDADHNTLTVYSCKPGGEPAKLVDDVYAVYGVKTDGGKASFYYAVQDVEKYTLYDLVTDKMAGEDAAALSESLEYPDWYSGYYPSTVYFENGAWYYETYSGDRFAVDKNALIASYGSAGEEVEYYAAQDVAYADARTRYDQATEDYTARYEAWNAAQSREYIRNDLKSSETRLTSLSLYRYTGAADGDPIASGVNQSQWNYAAEDGVFLYKKSAGPDGGKVGDVSDSDIYDRIYSGSSSGSDDDWYQNVGGVESVIDFDEDVTSIYDVIVLNGKEVILDCYFLAGPKDNRRTERVANAYTLGGTSLTFANTVAEDDFSGLRPSADGKSLCFFTDVESKDWGNLGDLTRYSGGGKTEVIAKGLYGAVILDDSGVIYGITDVDSRGKRELSLLQGDKPTVITDELTGEVVFLDSRQLLYIADDDLCLWDGKENRRLARDVTAIWANSEVDYTGFSPW